MSSIVHLITSLHGGGTELYLWQLISCSPTTTQHRVFFLKEDGVMGERIRALGVQVQKTTPVKLFLHLRQTKPDVLHTCLYRSHQVGRVVGRLAGVRAIVSSQQAIDGWQQPWHRWLDQWTLRSCDAVFANSRAAGQLISDRRGPRSTPRIVQVPNGIDTRLWSQTDTAAARSVYGLPMDAVVGGALMRLHREKGADRIPGFAAQLLKANPRLFLLIGGTGPLEQALKSETARLPEANRIRWVGWEEKPQRLFGASDFAWLLSREESFPQALLEASSLGLPWVAPDIGGIAELRAAGAVAELFSDEKNAPEAAQRLLDALARRQTEARQAADKIRHQFSIEKSMRSFYTSLSTLVI